MTRRDLSTLLAILRRNGVTKYSDGGLTLELGAAGPVPNRPPTSTEATEEDDPDEDIETLLQRAYAAPHEVAG